MSLQELLDSEQDKLKKFAVILADDFLKIRRGQRVVSLNNYDWQILDFIRQHMQEYFTGRGEDVTVQLGTEGYDIDVEYYARCFPNILAQ